MNLALDEIISNVIEHGYEDTLEHEIPITVRFEGDLLTIEIEDDGRPFNPVAEPLPDVDLPLEERPIGGLGILILRSMADGHEYRRERGRNILRIEKRIAERRSP